SLALAADRFERRRGRRTVQTLYQATNATKSELRTVPRQQLQHQLHLVFSLFPPYKPRNKDSLLQLTSQTMAPRRCPGGRSTISRVLRGRISISEHLLGGPI